MNQFFSRCRLVATLAVALAGVGVASAGSCGAGGCDDGYGGFGFNRAWVYPFGGFTLYPGQAGSCVPSHSDYAKVDWTVPPTVNAQGVLDRLRALGVPQVPPDTIFLGKNPRGANDVKLPVPKGWVPKEVEPEKPKDKAVDPDKEKDPVKPKDKKKKDPDDDR